MTSELDPARFTEERKLQCVGPKAYAASPREQIDEFGSHHSCAAVSAGVSGLGFAAARDFTALALWGRGCGAHGNIVDQSPRRSWSKLVADASARPHRLWRLAVSILVVLCREFVAHQSGLVDGRRIGAAGRLSGAHVFAG